jgi:hypothetical protein
MRAKVREAERREGVEGLLVVKFPASPTTMWLIL